MTKRVPEIRFEGFTDDWEQRKLSDALVEMKSGLSRLLSNEDIGLPVIRANNINNGTLDLVNDIKYWYVNDSQGADTRNYLVHKSDILVNFINSEAKMGTATIVTTEPVRDTIYTTNVLKLKTNENNNPYFIFSLTMTGSYDKYVKIITKPAVNQASFTTVDFKKYEFFAPKLEEQIQIGTFFKKLDDTIALHQRKLEQLQSMKDGFLQKMFPKDGEKEPEIRFSGFTDDWEQRKLGEIAQFNPKSQLPDEFEYVDLESVVGTNLVLHRTENKETAPSRAQRLAKIGDVFYQTVRPYQKNNYLYDLSYDNYVFSTGYAQLRPYGNSYFLLSRVQDDRFVNNVLDRSTGTSYPAINSTDLAQIELTIPKENEEEHKIGSFFKSLDNTITLHQRELELLKQTKKAFLQKMFV